MANDSSACTEDNADSSADHGAEPADMGRAFDPCQLITGGGWWSGGEWLVMLWRNRLVVMSLVLVLAACGSTGSTTTTASPVGSMSTTVAAPTSVPSVPSPPSTSSSLPPSTVSASSTTTSSLTTTTVTAAAVLGPWKQSLQLDEGSPLSKQEIAWWGWEFDVLGALGDTFFALATRHEDGTIAAWHRPVGGSWREVDAAAFDGGWLNDQSSGPGGHGAAIGPAGAIVDGVLYTGEWSDGYNHEDTPPGRGAVWTSLDGITWTRTQLASIVPDLEPDAFLITVLGSGEHGFVALGEAFPPREPNGPVVLGRPVGFFSPDGVTWETVDMTPFVAEGVGTEFGHVNLVGWGGGRYVALGWNPATEQDVQWESDDGRTWSVVEAGLPPVEVLPMIGSDRLVAAGPAGFLALRALDGGTSTELRWSTNGTAWTVVPYPDEHDPGWGVDGAVGEAEVALTGRVATGQATIWIANP